MTQKRSKQDVLALKLAQEISRRELESVMMWHSETMITLEALEKSLEGIEDDKIKNRIRSAFSTGFMVRGILEKELDEIWEKGGNT